MSDEEATAWESKVCFVDDNNVHVDMGRDYEEGGQAPLEESLGLNMERLRVCSGVAPDSFLLHGELE